MSRPVLSLQGIGKSYPGVRAVDNVSLSFDAGEIHALIGENGAGKSTLIKILAGAVRPDTGSIAVAGHPVEFRSTHDAYRHGLAFVHQELNLVPFLDGAENIFLGRTYPRTRFGTVDWNELRRQAARTLAELGTPVPVDVPAGRLAPGEQTMLSIARAFVNRPRVLVMDEPTATLTAQEVGHLFEVVWALKNEGVTVIYVSHRLQEILTLTDRVTVMRNGKVVATQPVAGLEERDLIVQMTGREFGSVFPSREGEAGEPVLEVEDLRGPSVRGLSFSVHRGEIVGLAGLVGAGRTEALRLLFGATRAIGGQIRLQGRVISPRSPRHALKAGIALVPEERRSQGLILSRPIFENMTLSHLDRYARRGLWLDRARELSVAQRLATAVQLRANRLTQPVGQLSGGNQQKVVFARYLAAHPRLLLLDEPTRGVDVGAKTELYALIRRLAAEGAAIVVASSELPELLGLADRIVALHEGRQVGIFTTTATDEQTLLAACYGSGPT